MRILVFSAMILYCLSGTIQAQIFGLGDLPGGGFNSFALDVSSDGSVVIGRSSSSIAVEAFRWTQSGGMVGLGSLSNVSSEAKGVSADGSVVVGRTSTTSGTEAFRWTQNGGMVGLGDLTGGTLPGGAIISVGYDVSADGSVVAGYSQTADGREAFRWTETNGMIGLGDLPGGSIRSFGRSLSADGSVVVGESSGTNGTEAFRWTETGGMVGLGGLFAGNFDSEAWDVSPDGSTVVGEARVDGSTIEAMRWTEDEGMVSLGDLPGGLYSEARAVSDDGSIVIGRSGTDNGEEAFYWTQDLGMVRLYDLLDDQGEDLSHWTSLGWAYEMTGDGRTIIGRGINIDGNTEAFVATISSVPEPSSGILLIGTLVGFGLRRQRRQSI